MTMFITFAFEEFAFVAVDKQVSLGATVTNITSQRLSFKILENDDRLVTGSGLQNIIEEINNKYELYGINTELFDELRNAYPEEFINMTRVVILPKKPNKNIQIMHIDFSKSSLSQALHKIDGTVGGSGHITNEHRSTCLELAKNLSSKLVNQRSTHSSYSEFLNGIASVFLSVNSLTNEVSKEFDYAFVFKTGQTVFNKIPA